MNTSNLIDYLSASNAISKKEATAHVAVMLEGMAKGIASGKLELHGFGNFRITTRAARTGRNPKTGEPMQIAAKRSVGFKAASKLKAAVN